MPRIEGLSSRSTIWFNRVKPRPLTTSLCFTGVQICERKYWILIFFSAAIIPLFIPPLCGQDQSLLELFLRLAAQRRYLGPVAQLDERVKRRLDHVMRVRRAQALGQHVLHAR